MTAFEGGAEQLSHVTVVLLALKACNVFEACKALKACKAFEACKALEAYKSFQAHKALQAKDKQKTNEGQDHRDM